MKNLSPLDQSYQHFDWFFGYLYQTSIWLRHLDLEGYWWLWLDSPTCYLKAIRLIFQIHTSFHILSISQKWRYLFYWWDFWPVCQIQMTLQASDLSDSFIQLPSFRYKAWVWPTSTPTPGQKFCYMTSNYQLILRLLIQSFIIKL